MHRRQFIGSAVAASLAALPVTRLLAKNTLPSSLAARRLSGAETTLPAAAITEFEAALRGELLLPGYDGYDAARRVWNGMIDRRPALIARCSGAADVAAAVQFARSHDLLVAVRGGGHSTSGQSVCDGGLMIDLSGMHGVRVDPDRRKAYVASGSLLGELDRESQFFGLATTAGTVSHTGAAGLTLGGGFGRLGRRFGLTCDNLVGVDVVTADGKLVHASSDENADLFWGLRGGGGNFGVATAFEYQLHPMDPTVLGGGIMYPYTQAREVLDFYTDFASRAPDALNVDLAIISRGAGKPVVAMEVCYSGDLQEGERAIRELRSFGKPLVDQIQPMPYVKLQTGSDAANAPGRLYYVKSGFVQGVEPGMLDAMVEAYRPDAGRATVLLMQQLGGAIARVPTEATAFPHRDARFDLVTIAAWTDPAQSAHHKDWVRGFWNGVGDYTHGFYFNTTTGDEQDKVRANYGPNYPRMVAVKKRYDPGNLFRLNANISPG